jgi:hypothetical protein
MALSLPPAVIEDGGTRIVTLRSPVVILGYQSTVHD